MLTLLGRVTGMIPGVKGKTGKRETALFWSLMAFGLTLIAFFRGPDMVTAGTALLMAIWGFAAALVAAALGMEWSQVSGMFRQEARATARRDDQPLPDEETTMAPDDWKPGQ